MKVRGWVAIVGGAFVVVMMVAIWAYMAMLSTVPGTILCDLASRNAFLGRVYVTFATVVLCGLLAILNGIVMLRTGAPNRILFVGVIGLFLGACWIGYGAGAACIPP